MNRSDANAGAVPPPPPLSPYLTVPDARGAIAFYERAFGAQVAQRQETPDGKRIIHAALVVNGGWLMLSDDFPEMSGGRSRTPAAFGGTSVTIHLDLADVDAVWARAVEAGAKVVMPLADQFWGDRYGILEDPAGHRWSLATRGKPVSAADLAAGAEKHFPKKA
jgi:PhnB protein